MIPPPPPPPHYGENNMAKLEAMMQALMSNMATGSGLKRYNNDISGRIQEVQHCVMDMGTNIGAIDSESRRHGELEAGNRYRPQQVEGGDHPGSEKSSIRRSYISHSRGHKYNAETENLDGKLIQRRKKFNLAAPHRPHQRLRSVRQPRCRQAQQRRVRRHPSRARQHDGPAVQRGDNVASAIH